MKKKKVKDAFIKELEKNHDLLSTFMRFSRNISSLSRDKKSIANFKKI